MEKVSLRHIYLEIGRMCNLKCIHCCKGEPEDAKMSDKVMDALLDNVHFIDEITITGGEPMLYTERIETLLDKCKKRNIKVNYFNVITNCTIKSEKFVRVFNAWHDYCTFGNDNELTISTDKYHKSYRGNFGEAEKEIEKIKLFTSLCVKERNKIIEKVNNAIDLYEKNNDIMDKGQFKEFVKNICEVDQSAIPLKEIIEQITNIEKIFKQRKESNNPGSLFIEPEYDYIKAFFDIASLFKK